MNAFRDDKEMVEEVRATRRGKNSKIPPLAGKKSVSVYPMGKLFLIGFVGFLGIAFTSIISYLRLNYQELLWINVGLFLLALVTSLFFLLAYLRGFLAVSSAGIAVRLWGRVKYTRWEEIREIKQVNITPRREGTPPGLVLELIREPLSTRKIHCSWFWDNQTMASKQEWNEKITSLIYEQSKKYGITPKNIVDFP